MREYGSVQTQFWSDLALQTLSTHAKLLAVYLLTGPHTTMLGCFRLPTGYVAEDLKWNEQTVCKSFTELNQVGFLTYDTELAWVCIHHFLIWNPIENPNQGKSLSKIFNRVPPLSTVFKPLIKILLTQTKYLDKGFQNHLATLSQPFRNQEQNQEQEKDQEQEQDVVDKPSINDGLLSSNLKTSLSTNKNCVVGTVTDKETLGIPIQNSDVFIPGKTDIDTWKKTYPNIDVLQELRQIIAWNEANPTERKTQSQILRHINAWLAKEQRESLQRQQAPPMDHSATHLATRGLSPTLAHNLVVGEQWLNHSQKIEK